MYLIGTKHVYVQAFVIHIITNFLHVFYDKNNYRNPLLKSYCPKNKGVGTTTMFLPKDETGVRHKNYFLRPKFESEKGFGVWLWDIGVTLEQRKNYLSQI